MEIAQDADLFLALRHLSKDDQEVCADLYPLHGQSLQHHYIFRTLLYLALVLALLQAAGYSACRSLRRTNVHHQTSHNRICSQDMFDFRRWRCVNPNQKPTKTPSDF